jgi:hypothetical protein
MANKCDCITALSQNRCRHYRAYECCKEEDLKNEPVVEKVFIELGTPTTIGELKKLISNYSDDTSFGFRNQRIQTLYQNKIGEETFIVFQ